MQKLIIGLVGLGLVGCVAPEGAPEPPAVATDTVIVDLVDQDIWKFADHADALRAASCPEGTVFTRPQSMPIKAVEIDRGSAAEQAAALHNLTFAGAWHLSSDEPNFGGLSGLAVMRPGLLLAISDAGAFVWIGIDPYTGSPDEIGLIGYMRDVDGKVFGRKVEADSEGLAFREGLALVSFEQDHRIAAFDIEGCGTSARAAPVVDLPAVILGKRVPDNRGAEALALHDDGGLQVGFETATREGSPTGHVVGDRELSDMSRLNQPSLYLLTGMDYHAGMVAHIYRSYDPIRGSRIQLRVSSVASGEDIAFADLKSPLPVDNFEGVTFGTSPTGKTRLWLISDDNFNPRQRTLLFAFDLD